MKKYFLIALALGVAVFASGCRREMPETVTFSSASTAGSGTTSHVATDKTVSIDERVVEKATDPNAPEDTKKSSSSKSSRKKKSSQSPTQGEVTDEFGADDVTLPSLGTFDEDDLRVVYDEAYVDLNDEIDDVLAILGEDNSVSEPEENKTEYEYEGFTFITYIDSKDTERMEKITFSTEDFKTPKDAYVGMYATQLRYHYGEPTKKTDSAYIYSKGKKSLEFSVQNNRVTSISYVLER